MSQVLRQTTALPISPFTASLQNVHNGQHLCTMLASCWQQLCPHDITPNFCGVLPPEKHTPKHARLPALPPCCWLPLHPALPPFLPTLPHLPPLFSHPYLGEKAGVAKAGNHAHDLTDWAHFADVGQLLIQDAHGEVACTRMDRQTPSKDSTMSLNTARGLTDIAFIAITRRFV